MNSICLFWRTSIALIILSSYYVGNSQSESEVENLIVITLDGVRWKEVFGGADSVLLNNPKFLKTEGNRLTKKFWDDTEHSRRKRLMPFLWSEISSQGRIYGNRWYNNRVNVSNKTNISNPGYSEIFTGYVDPEINSNELKYNKNTNVFEFINEQEDFAGKVAAFASWSKIHGYLNSQKNDFIISGGYSASPGTEESFLQQTLNSLQSIIHRKEESRPDYITYLHAKEFIRINHPKLLSIGFAWTDDMAHDGSYPMYLEKIFTFDAMIEDLWSYLESIPQYKNKTALLITVDHGRGDNENWTSHGPHVPHSNEIWFAIMGPGISPKGEMKESNITIYQNQFAATISNLLGYKFKSENVIGDSIDFDK